MALALDNLQRFDKPLNKETKPNQSVEFLLFCAKFKTHLFVGPLRLSGLFCTPRTSLVVLLNFGNNIFAQLEFLSALFCLWKETMYSF